MLMSRDQCVMVKFDKKKQKISKIYVFYFLKISICTYLHICDVNNSSRENGLKRKIVWKNVENKLCLNIYITLFKSKLKFFSW